MQTTPLADAIRPRSMDEIVGQKHLFGEKGILRRMVNMGRVSNMIFYGPPGTGKTTAASVIAAASGMEFYKLNATTASLQDVKDILNQTDGMFGTNGILLYLDEIQYFNRKQQQSLLEYMEDGRIVLIASTTENPHFYVYNAIISRSSLFEFKPVPASDCLPMLDRALAYLNERGGTSTILPQNVALALAEGVGGDVRRAIGLLENAYFAAGFDEGAIITLECVTAFDSGVSNFNDDVHYDLLGCLQKSIRGSDPDATAFYVAKMLSTGDMFPLMRRLQVIASEDIGLAYPQAAAIVRACCESARELGMPEARIPLINAALLLATSPKSNSAYLALAAADEDVQAGRGQDIPIHLQSPLFKGYIYPHDYPNHYVEQQYLPKDLKDKTYYVPGPNKTEQAADAYWKAIKNK
ncbi:MAG: replication-associated recombination protein A [Ruminococcaceae bacterium]|nr:replication-associated recombination protein A [Oscillospiraceae bacterium]